jgi:hypothetical protein
MLASFSTSQNWGDFFFKHWSLVINLIVLKVFHSCDFNLELANGNMEARILQFLLVMTQRELFSSGDD